MRKYQQFTLFVLLLLACAGTAMATAPDMTYSGEVDSYTGAPLYAVEEGPATLVQLTTMADYDTQRKCYVIYSNRSAGQFLNSNVAPDMVVTEPVYFDGALLETALLYRNGAQVEDVDWMTIKEPGQYKLSLGDASVPGAFSVSFTIVGTATGQLSLFQPPRGFYVTDATKDGGETPWSDGSVTLEENGQYQITYQCAATEEVYVLDVTIDHMPPTLALSNVVDGVASGVVSLADLEEGAYIAISCNGEAISPTAELKQSGDYTVQVMDAAGNSNTYQFTIPIYLNESGILFFLLIVMSIVALVSYLWRAKTHLRVR